MDDVFKGILMKKLILLFVLILGFSVAANATSIKPTDLSVLVTQADYIVVGKVVKMDMIDANGQEIFDKKARTGPRSGKMIRYFVAVDRKKTLKGDIKKIPQSLVLPDWPMWIRGIDGMKEMYEGKNCIFLLGAPNLFPKPQSQFVRDISEKSEIVRILRSEHRNTNH